MSTGILIPPGPVRVLVATRPVDFRKGMYGLAALVKEQLGSDPFSGVIYVFRSKRKDGVKRCSGMAAAYACLRNAWRKGSSVGRALRMV